MNQLATTKISRLLIHSLPKMQRREAGKESEDGLERVIQYSLLNLLETSRCGNIQMFPEKMWKQFHIITCTTETWDTLLCTLLITDEKCCFWGTSWWWEETNNAYSAWEILTWGFNSWHSLVEKTGIFYQWLISLEIASRYFGKLGIN